jgi:hypothetical protein
LYETEDVPTPQPEDGREHVGGAGVIVVVAVVVVSVTIDV